MDSKREKETGIAIRCCIRATGRDQGVGSFKSSNRRTTTMHIGDPKQAAKLQQKNKYALAASTRG